VLTDSPSPIVVVLSGSMEPVFHRGDLLVLSNHKAAVDVGDVVVYNVKGRDIPIVHRVINQHWTSKDGVDKQFLLTKGDNNPTDDLELYARGQTYLDRQEEIIGLVYGYHFLVFVVGTEFIRFVPYVGMVTIWMNEIKWVKFAVIGGLGLMAILQRDG